MGMEKIITSIEKEVSIRSFLSSRKDRAPSFISLQKCFFSCTSPESSGMRITPTAIHAITAPAKSEIKMNSIGKAADNIKMDLREIEWDGLDWIDLAQDRDQ